jgi:hypothetical protein
MSIRQANQQWQAKLRAAQRAAETAAADGDGLLRLERFVPRFAD